MYLKMTAIQSTPVLFFFRGGKKLIFEDTRKFGRIYKYNDLTEINKRHGPDHLVPILTPTGLLKI